MSMILQMWHQKYRYIYIFFLSGTLDRILHISLLLNKDEGRRQRKTKKLKSGLIINKDEGYHNWMLYQQLVAFTI